MSKDLTKKANKEIIDVIAKNLPEMQVAALKMQLEKADQHEELENKIEYLEEKLLSRNEEISALNKTLNEHKAVIEVFRRNEQSILDREEILKSDRFNLDLIIANKDKQNAIDALGHVKELAMAAFRNPTVVKSYNSSFNETVREDANHGKDHMSYQNMKDKTSVNKFEHGTTTEEIK